MIESSWGSESTQTGHLNQKSYTALSYTWGDPLPKAKIEIDGRPFHITQNLERALRHLRASRIAVKLWADSLCINQEDVEERNFHVSQMRSIYSAAQSTAIFLGEATEGSDALLHAIQSSRSSILAATTRSAVVKALVSNSGLRKQELIDQAFKILWRPYWLRIWIFQEIIVTSNPWVQCGSIKVPWETFCQAIIALLSHENKYFGGGYGNEPRQRLEDMYWERRGYRLAQGLSEPMPKWDMSGGREFEARMGLLDLLVSKRGAKASDERDMVFAVSGIARKPQGWRELRITYEESPARVYMDTVKYLLDHTSTYEVLSHAGAVQFQTLDTSPQAPQLAKLPSWVPDWRTPTPYKNKIVDWISPPTPSSTSPTAQKPVYAYLPAFSLLACKGHLYSTITTIDLSPSSIKPSPGSIGRVIWDNKHHRKILLEHGILSDLGTRLATVTSLINRSHPLTYRRRLAKLENEILALVPQEAEEGDLVVVFGGSGIPFVLRRREREKVEKLGLMGRLWAWWFGVRGKVKDLEEADLEIRKAINLRDGEGKQLPIEHCSFVGECFVGGLMHKNTDEIVKAGGKPAVFAMH